MSIVKDVKEKRREVQGLDKEEREEKKKRSARQDRRMTPEDSRSRHKYDTQLSYTSIQLNFSVLVSFSHHVFYLSLIIHSSFILYQIRLSIGRVISYKYRCV